MIDRSALKLAARNRMNGKKPSVFLVAVVYLVIVTILVSLTSALLGADRFFRDLQRVLLVTPTPTGGMLAGVLPRLTPVAAVLILSVLVARLLVDVGYKGYCLKVSRNEQAASNAIFDSFPLFLKVLRLEILRIFFIMLWSLLFILPGIVAFYRYRLAYFILLDNPETAPLACLRKSAHMMTGYKTSLFLLDFSFIGWAAVDFAVQGFVAVRLFSIWLAPYIGVTQAGFYNLLVESENGTDETGQKTV